MTPPALIDAQGRPFPLAAHLASGGEGAVFALPNDPAQVAKVYLKPGDPQRGEKLAAMVALVSPALKQMTAWPTAVLFDARTRAAAGFVMPRVSNGHPVQQLYNPVMRLKAFPRAGWTFQVAAARNLAAAFDEVHKAGCLVCDVNQSNALVLPDARVGLIDCDSFQVRAGGKSYLCDVGTPHYTPPELQGQHLRGLMRTENHDRFGLAVLIYQLLFVGRHPYAGVYTGPGDPSFEELIAGFKFAQGPRAQTWGMAPPPHTPTFADIPPELGNLFCRAFERGSEAGGRPRAAEWVPALQALEQESVLCAADPGHRYWRGAAGGCVWCRLAARGGPEYFFGAGGTSGTFEVDEEKLRDVLERLGRTRPAEFRYDRARFAPPAAPEPDPLPEGLDEHRNVTWIVGGAAALCALAMPLGLVRGFICVIALLGALAFGGWLAVLVARSPWRQEYRRRRATYRHASDDLADLEDKWRRRVRAYQRDHADSDRRVRRLVDECRALASQYQEEVRQLAAHAEAAALRRHLQLHPLADAEIPKIGAGRKQTLAAAGIVTAADVEWDRVRGIKGFGDALTNNVMAWKNEVLRAFRFDPRGATSPAEQQALVVKYRARQQQALAELERRLGELGALAPACRQAVEKLAPGLARAVAAFDQARANFRAVGAR
ncbi:hypothetical protein R5W24_001129 [Gemmata sp. JC717]|uniref:helix-hairpin-helix domain-containing protein n=1 Tax=Gemmata algarum TaxID=2975278 RepID=UPI0021BB6193|nr:hypothetical protein [Gemmata algarum]MDY3552049.1 hypothetical protein [Gemmata algarum]